jgi:hypothetical protein
MFLKGAYPRLSHPPPPQGAEKFDKIGFGGEGGYDGYDFVYAKNLTLIENILFDVMYRLDCFYVLSTIYSSVVGL